MPIIDFSDSFLRIYFIHLSINLEKEKMPSLRYFILLTDSKPEKKAYCLNLYIFKIKSKPQ